MGLELLTAKMMAKLNLLKEIPAEHRAVYLIFEAFFGLCKFTLVLIAMKLGIDVVSIIRYWVTGFP